MNFRKISILIVDDQNIVRQGIQALLGSKQDLRIVGTAKDGIDALKKVETYQPNVVLIDIEMPGMNGLTATQKICQRFSETKVIVLSSYEDEKYTVQAFQAGARGYLLKSTLAEDLEQAIRSINRGYLLLEPKILSKVFESNFNFSLPIIQEHRQSVSRRNDFIPRNYIKEFTNIIRLAFPLIAAQLGQVAMVFIDTVMMGMLGTQTLAGGGLGATVFSFTYTICVGIVSAVGNIVAHSFGTKKSSDISNTVRSGFVISTALALLNGLLLWNSSYFLHLFGQNELNIALAESFLRAALWSVAPGLWFITLRGFTVGLSSPGPIGIIVTIATFSNILLNYILIHGLFGLPNLGLAGIGWSTSINFLLMFIALLTVVEHQPKFAAYKVFSMFQRIKIKSLIEVIHLGLPIGVTYGIESALFTVAALLMGILGTTQLAAYQIAERTVYIAYMLPVGIYQAVSILIGQSFGINDIKSIRIIGRAGLVLGGLCSGTFALLFWLMPEQIVGLYIEVDQAKNVETFSLAIKFLAVAAIFLFFDGSQIIMSGALQGMKDSKSTLIISMIGYWMIGLPVSYLFGFVIKLGGIGIWWALAIALAITATMMTLCFEKKTQNIISLYAERNSDN